MLCVLFRKPCCCYNMGVASLSFLGGSYRKLSSYTPVEQVLNPISHHQDMNAMIALLGMSCLAGHCYGAWASQLGMILIASLP